MKSLIKIKCYICTVIISCTMMFSSCNYLDVQDHVYDMTPLDSVFARSDYLFKYLNGASAFLPNTGNLYSHSYGPFQIAVDECQMSWKKDEFGGAFLYLGEVSPENVQGYNYWNNYYKGIRKCNMIFARMDECKDLKATDRRDLLGMTHFLRASLYYHIMELYGPAVIMPEAPIVVDNDISEITFPRNTYDECVEYICKDLEAAYLYLDPKRTTTEFNKPTKYAAAFLLSRVRLFQASPWYNGNPFYSGWKTEEGKNFISQVYNPELWGKSAAAAKRIIMTGVYDLHTVPSSNDTPNFPAASQEMYPDGVGGIDPLLSYTDMFNGESLSIKNPEIIYPASGFNYQNTRTAFPLFMGGWSGLGVTQKLVDAYYQADGTDYEQTNDFFEPIGPSKSFSGYTLPGTAARMYDNKEMRFYASIGFSECFWPGTSVTDPNQQGGKVNVTVTYYADGNSIKQASNPEDYILTGYTLKKYIHPEDNYTPSGSIKGKTFPQYRYAEVLLNYVEALNEMKGEAPYSEEVDADGTTYTVQYSAEEIMKYFNMIRYRAGLPGISLADAQDQAKVKDLIKRERMIEFAHEGRRYHDLRRWGIAEEEENKPIQGMNLEAKKTDRRSFYTVTNIMHKYSLRRFEPKMYFYPIPKGVLNKNSKLVQNPGWDGWSGW